MRREEHLTKPQQYATVYDGGKSWACNLVVMKAIRNDLDYSRYGFSVSKRIGNAVVRNRVKRRLREILRVQPLEPSWDIVFIARQAAAGADFSTLRKATEGLLSRGRIIHPGQHNRTPADSRSPGNK